MNPAEFDSLERSEHSHWWFQGQTGILFDLLSGLKDPISSVLDAGCGTGFLAGQVERKFGWRVTALDASARAVSLAKERGLARVMQSDAAKLPFAGAAFDAVLSMDVLVHFPEGGERPAIEEFHRVLKPGGALVLRVSALDILRSSHSTFILEKQRFTLERLASELRQCGFEIKWASYVNSLLMPVALFKFRVWEPLTQSRPASGTAPVAPWLNKLLSIPLAVERKLLRMGMRFPAGQSIVIVGRKV